MFGNTNVMYILVACDVYPHYDLYTERYDSARRDTALPQISTASLFLVSDGGRSNYARGLSPSRRAPDVYRVYGNLSPDPITLVRAPRTRCFIHTRSS